MDEQRLQEIGVRLAKATPGPWGIEYHGARDMHELYTEVDDWALADIHGTGYFERDEANAAFIAHARTDIPDLIDEVKYWKTLYKQMVTDLKRSRTQRGEQGD